MAISAIKNLMSFSSQAAEYPAHLTFLQRSSLQSVHDQCEHSILHLNAYIENNIDDDEKVRLKSAASSINSLINSINLFDVVRNL